MADVTQEVSGFLDKFLTIAERTTDTTPKIVRRMAVDYFPHTLNSAKLEGCDNMFLTGVIKYAQQHRKKPTHEDRQRHLNEVDKRFLPLVKTLTNTSFMVPPSVENPEGQMLTVAELLADQAAFDSARKYQRLKGTETLSEADKLDSLYLFAFE